MNDVAQLIRTFRQESGLSQAQLADRAHMSVAAIGSLEQGSRRSPYRSTISAIADALDLSLLDRATLESAADRARGRSKPGADAPPANNIVADETPLIERDEMQEIYELLQQRRFVTITGSAGVGKTRTALAVAARWVEERANEAWFCDLSSIEDASFVISQIAGTIGLDLEDGSDRLTALTGALRDRTALLVIDNCEHLNGEAGRVTSAIVRACASITILATSRERLYLSAENVYRLPSLSEADSIELFIARAASADVRYSFTGTQPFIVADICRQLDGIPLAIELAASLVPSIGLTELALRIGQTVLPASVSPNSRQETMAIAIDRSYALLNDEESTLLRRLSVFSGTFPLSAIEELDRDRSRRSVGTASLVARLVETSLLRIHHNTEAARYSLLVSIRAYCLIKLDAANERAGAESSFVTWVCSVVANARERHAAIGLSAYLDLMRPEMNNLRIALSIAFAKTPGSERLAGLKLLESTVPAWWYTSRRAELAEFIKQGVELIDNVEHPELAAHLLLTLCRAATGPAVFAATERAVPALLSVDRKPAAAMLLSNVAVEYCQREEFDQATAALNEANTIVTSLAAEARTGNDYTAHLAASCEAFGLLRNFGAARTCLAEIRTIGLTMGGSRQHAAVVAQMTTRLDFYSGADREHVIATCEDVVRQTADAPELAISSSLMLSNLACYRLIAADAAGAAREALEALRIGAFGPYVRAETVLHLAAAAALLGQPLPAARALGCIDAFFQRSEIRFPSLEYVDSHALLMRALESALPADKIAGARARGAECGMTEMTAELAAALPIGAAVTLPAES